MALTSNFQELANLILKYKVDKLRGLGLEFIAEPDIETAGGLDNLRQFLEEKVVKLNEPSAKKYQLRPRVLILSKINQIISCTF